MSYVCNISKLPLVCTSFSGYVKSYDYYYSQVRIFRASAIEIETMFGGTAEPLRKGTIVVAICDVEGYDWQHQSYGSS